MSMIDDIKRDREAGTPGPWRAKAVGGDSVSLCEAHRWHRFSEGYQAYPLMIPRKSEDPEKLFDP